MPITLGLDVEWYWCAKAHPNLTREDCEVVGPTDNDGGDLPKIAVKCPCGWQGILSDLLVHVGCNGFHCPACLSTGWTWR